MRLTYDSRATGPSSVHTTTQLAPSPSAKVSSSAAANADDSNGGSSGSTGSRLSRYSRSPPSYFQRRVTPLFSSVSVISVPGSSTALLRSSRSSSSTGTCAVSKYFGFGHTVTRVPVALFVPLADIDFSGCVTSPSPNPMVCILPSRQTVTSRRDASALVTETPTPCRPPENEYAPPARLSNLPPACRRVNTISTTGAFSSGMQADRNAAAVVVDGDRSVLVQRHVDPAAGAREDFVRRVVDHFLHRVQGAVGARVHARPLLDGLEPFQHADRCLAVLGGGTATR